MAIEMLNFRKKIFKHLILRTHKGDEAETLHKCLCYYPLHIFFFFFFFYYCCCACGFVAMTTLSFHRKSESKPLFLSDFRYFDKSFTVMFLE